MSDAHPVPELTPKLAGLLEPPSEPEDDAGPLGWLIGRAVDVAILTLALLNLTAVFFDYSYVMLRPQYLHYAPAVAKYYDVYKGIDPYRSVQDYLHAANDCLALASSSVDTPEAAKALSDMQKASKDLIKDEDAFGISGQRGVLERIKHLASRHMAEHAGEPAIMGLVPVTDRATKISRPAATMAEARREFMDHSTLSLGVFWTPENLRGRTEVEAAWFQKRIAPLLDRAYYRHYGEDGKPLEEFWRVDLGFSLFFLLELVLRGIWMLGFHGGRGKTFKQRWKAFTTQRWMDFAYFLPLLLYAPIINDLLPGFVRESLQLVRMFSVGYRMQRLGLINPVEVVQAKVAEVMDIITDQVNVKLLSNYQASVRELDIAAAMKSLTPQQREQLTVLIQRNLTMVLHDVLPDVTPQVEKLIMRAARQALEQAPAYQQLKRLPFFGGLPERFLPTVVAEVMAGTQVTMLKAINDVENMKLTNELIDVATDSLIRHMAEVGTEAQVKQLLFDLLEEQKRRVLAD